jgi:hypothetical protein
MPTAVDTIADAANDHQWMPRIPALGGLHAGLTIAADESCPAGTSQLEETVHTRRSAR